MCYSLNHKQEQYKSLILHNVASLQYHTLYGQTFLGPKNKTPSKNFYNITHQNFLLGFFCSFVRWCACEERREEWFEYSTWKTWKLRNNNDIFEKLTKICLKVKCNWDHIKMLSNLQKVKVFMLVRLKWGEGWAVISLEDFWDDW